MNRIEFELNLFVCLCVGVVRFEVRDELVEQRIGVSDTSVSRRREIQGVCSQVSSASFICFFVSSFLLAYVVLEKEKIFFFELVVGFILDLGGLGQFLLELRDIVGFKSRYLILVGG